MTIKRVVVAFSVLLAFFGVQASYSAESSLEPGLTSRIACLALSRIPEKAKLRLAGSESALLLNLQSAAEGSATGPAEMLRKMFNSSGKISADANDLALAARAVVKLTLPASSESVKWEAFRISIALRTVSGEVADSALPDTTNADTFVEGLRTAGMAAIESFGKLDDAADPEAYSKLRKKTAATAVTAVASVWARLLEQGMAEKAKPTEAVIDTPSAPVSETVQQENQAPINLIGNKFSKKFHRTDCRFLPNPENQVGFVTRSEALRAGFTPCRICKP